MLLIFPAIIKFCFSMLLYLWSDILAEKSVEYDIEIERRVRYNKMMPGEQAQDTGLTLKEEIKTQMLECIDRFHT